MIRTLILCILLVLPLPMTATAQNQSLDCYDGTTLNGLFSVTIPATTLENGEFHTVTTIATDAITPRLHATGLVPEVDFCLPPNPLAAGYQVTMNDMTVAPLADGGQETFFNETDVTLSVGVPAQTASSFALIIEGGSYNPDAPVTNRRFGLNLTPDLITGGQTVNVAVFPLNDTVGDLGIITLTQNDAPIGESIPLDDAEISTYTLSEPLTGESAVGWQIIPDEAMLTGTIQLDLRTVALDDVMIVITFSTGTDSTTVESADDTLPATRIRNDDGLTVSCGDDISLTNPLQIDLPAADTERTITVISTEGGNPVVTAFIDDTDTGECVTESPDAVTYAADLPDYITSSSSNHPQITVPADATTIYTGSITGTTAQLLVIIEGATTDEPDTYAITPTGTMFSVNQPLAVYMMATDDVVNPILSVVDAEGAPALDADDRPIQCDDAGFADRCYGTTPTLSGANITISAGQLNGFAEDALLLIPLIDQSPDMPILVQAAQVNPDSDTGAYILMIQYASD